MKGALVTGAGMRIGRALAMALAADGFYVFVHHHRSATGARETVAEIVKAGGKAKVVKADLSSARQAEALDFCEFQLGTIRDYMEPPGSPELEEAYVGYVSEPDVNR